MKNEDFMIAILILISWNMAPGVIPSSPAVRRPSGRSGIPWYRVCPCGSSFTDNAARKDSSRTWLGTALPGGTGIHPCCLRIRGGHGNAMVLDERGHTFLPEEQDLLGRDALDELQRVKEEREMLRKRHDRFTDSVDQVSC